MAEKKASTRKSASKKSTYKEESESYGKESADDGVGVALIETGRGIREITYVNVDGMAMIEGDICLGEVDDVDQKTANMRAQLNTPGLAAAALISGANRRWPDCEVPFQIASGVTNQSRITDAIDHWESNTRFRFIERTAANAPQFPDFVEFVSGSGCSSFVGKRGGRQTITMSTSCSTGNMIHEIGHAVGLWHEQSREDRDSFVTIQWANIQPNRASNFNQHITDGDDVGPYDYGSIMHYPRKAFSRNGQDTIVPTDPNASIGQRTGLSAGDIAAVNSLCPPIVKPLPKDIGKELPKEIGKEIPKEVIKEGPKEGPKELPKEFPKEIKKEVIKEFPKEGPKEFPKEGPKEFPKEGPKELPKEFPKEIKKEVIKEGPKEGPKELPKEFPKEIKKEVIKEVPKEFQKEFQKEVPFDNPKRLSDDLGKSLRGDIEKLPHRDVAKSLANDLGLPGTGPVVRPGTRPTIPFVLATGADAGVGAGAAVQSQHAQATLDVYVQTLAQYEAYDALGLLGPHDRDEWQQMASEAQALAASLGLI